MTDTMLWYVVYKYIMTLYYLGYVLRVASYSCLSFITVDYVQLSFYDRYDGMVCGVQVHYDLVLPRVCCPRGVVD